MRTAVVGYGAAALATIIWAGNFVLARAVADIIPPWQCNFWRWLIALVAMLPFAWSHLRRDWPAICRRWPYLSVMGILGVTLLNTFIYKAGQTTESLNMALLVPTAPILILLLSRIVYGEKITPPRLAGMLIVVAGVVILISRGDWQRLAALRINPGDFWALGGTVCFGLYSLLMHQRGANISSLSFSVITFALGLLYALPCTVAEAFLLPRPVFSRELLFALLYAGLGCSAMAFWLWTVASDRIGPVKAGMVYYTLPVFAGVAAVLFLGEQVVAAQLVGGALIVCGICTATFPFSRPFSRSRQ